MTCARSSRNADTSSRAPRGTIERAPRFSRTASLPGGDTMATPPTVLFLCPHNALRSVIAAALFNQQANGAARGESAGTEPDDRVNERTITVLREVGIEVGDEKPGQLTPEQLRRADRVISL